MIYLTTENVIDKIKEVIYIETNTMVSFIFEEQRIWFYPYSGWHTGKSIVDGRGWKKLYNQIKQKK